MAKPKLPRKSSSSQTAAPTPVSPASAVTPAAEIAQGVPVEASPASPAETTKTKARTPASKPELVKTDSRANLVPINLEEEIRRFAYLLSERRGFAPGHEAEDWIAAEQEVRDRYHQRSA